MMIMSIFITASTTKSTISIVITSIVVIITIIIIIRGPPGNPGTLQAPLERATATLSERERAAGETGLLVRSLVKVTII